MQAMLLSRPPLPPATLYRHSHHTTLRRQFLGVCWARRSKGQDQGSSQPELPPEDIAILKEYYLASLEQQVKKKQRVPQKEQPAPPGESGKDGEAAISSGPAREGKAEFFSGTAQEGGEAALTSGPAGERGGAFASGPAGVGEGSLASGTAQEEGEAAFTSGPAKEGFATFAQKVGAAFTSEPPAAGSDGRKEVPVVHIAASRWEGKGAAEPEPLATPAQPLQPPPRDVGEAAKQVAKAATELADTARQAAEEVAATAEKQGQRVTAQAEDAQQEVLYTAEALAQGVQSDASDATAALEQTAGDIQSDLTKAAEGVAETVVQTAGDYQSDLAEAAEGVAEAAGEAAVGTVEGALSQPAPAAPAAEAARPSGSSSSHSSGGGDGGASSVHSSPSPQGEGLPKLKLRLVEVLASLDRGVAATREQRDLVDGLCKELQAVGGPVVLSWERKTEGQAPTNALLDGRWRLLYSSGFSSGSLGGLRPGPPVNLSPVFLGQVYQDINVERGSLDNVVDLIAKYSLAGLPGLNAETPVATARLKHSMQIVGSNTVEITFDATTVNFSGGFRGWLDGLPALNLPGLQDLVGLPKRARSATFDVVYLDRELRITRGDRGELRVFVRGGL